MRAKQKQMKEWLSLCALDIELCAFSILENTVGFIAAMFEKQLHLL